MKNIDIKVHKAKLGMIRNRLLLIYGAFLFLWAFSFVMGFLVLNRLEELSQEIREGQKGNTCILLIKPEDRNKQNLSDCIESNQSKGGVKFDFKEPKKNPSFKLSVEPPLNESKTPLSVIPRPTYNYQAPIPVKEEPKLDVEVNQPKVNEKKIIETNVQIHLQDELELRIR